MTTTAVRFCIEKTPQKCGVFYLPVSQFYLPRRFSLESPPRLLAGRRDDRLAGLLPAPCLPPCLPPGLPADLPADLLPGLELRVAGLPSPRDSAPEDLFANGFLANGLWVLPADVLSGRFPPCLLWRVGDWSALSGPDLS